jgi:hypothetical protein
MMICSGSPLRLILSSSNESLNKPDPLNQLGPFFPWKAIGEMAIRPKGEEVLLI